MRRMVLASTLAFGCGLCEDECSGGVDPIEGTSDDFSWDKVRVAGVEVDGPNACPDAGIEAFTLTVTLTGTNAVDSGPWLVDELRPALADAGVSTGWGQSACDSDGVALIVHSWSDADAVVAAAHERATAQDVRVELLLSVEARPHLCPENCEA